MAEDRTQDVNKASTSEKDCRPHLPESQVSAFVEKNWDVDTEGFTIKGLPSYDELNYALTLNNGERYVLKATRVHTLDWLDVQSCAYNRCSQAGMKVAKLVVARSGKQVVQQSTEWPDCFCRLMTYLPGNSLQNVVMETKAPPSLELFYDIGVTAGRMSQALDGMTHPAAEHDFDWDLSSCQQVCQGKRQFVSADADKTKIVDWIQSGFQKHVMSQWDTLRKSIIHSDLNDGNILVSGDAVTGVIDFGDIIYSATVFEIGICVAYCMMLDTNNVMKVAKTVLKGYVTKFQLTDEEVNIVFWCAAARLIISVLFSAEGQIQEPDNEYLKITSKPGWAVLTQLSTMNPTEVTDKFRKVVDDLKVVES